MKYKRYAAAALAVLTAFGAAAVPSAAVSGSKTAADGSYTVATVDTDYEKYTADITVEVKDGKISDLSWANQVGAKDETKHWNKTTTALKEKYVGVAATVDAVDAISSATETAEAKVAETGKTKPLDYLEQYKTAIKKALSEAPESSESKFKGYVLMNIPYDEFYKADNADAKAADVDAVSSATNKTGNYGKAGGAFHSGTTAEKAEDGTVTAVGGANGSKVQGVIWAVKADSLDAVKALGGKEILDNAAVTTATVGRGQASSTDLVSYETLTEAPAYSYYVLDEVPDNYLVLDDKSFKAGKSEAAVSKKIDISASYGTNWGDVQLNLGDAADELNDKIVNAIVLTADDGTTRGLYHLDQIWAFNDVAWRVQALDGLDGKKITKVTYYASDKDADLTDGKAPEYKNYVYEYEVDLDVTQVYTGEISAKFRDEKAIRVTGIPEDAENVKAKVYYTTGGRNAQYTYLTPLVVDPKDDDIDPDTVEVKDGKIAIQPGSVTNAAGTTLSFGEPVDGTKYTIELSCDNYILNKFTVEYKAEENEKYSGYVLMNIPYDKFYSAGKAELPDVDAVSSATNKTGNYGKAGGAYHSGVTAGTDSEGNVIAVGGENGSKVQGVIWAVKADKLEDVEALGGKEILDSAKVTTATAGHGNVSSNDLVSYETLTEAPAYSYFVLDKAPDNYLELDGENFKDGKSEAAVSKKIDVSASYGTNWGDVQLNVGEAEEAADKIVNAMILTAEDGTTRGLYHLDQIWAFNQVAWKVAVTDGLDGKKITKITYYCSDKDADLTDGTAPEYKNYVYEYAVDLDVTQVYSGEVTAEFDGDSALKISGLPEDAQNVAAKVYFTTGGRNAEYTYITPLVVDIADDDIDPVFVEVKDGVVSIVKASVTNAAGTTQSYGELVDGTTYTIELSADNYIIGKITAVYTAPEPTSDDSSTADDSSSTADDSSSTADDSSSTADDSSSTADDSSSTSDDSSSIPDDSSSTPDSSSSSDTSSSSETETAEVSSSGINYNSESNIHLLPQAARPDLNAGRVIDQRAGTTTDGTADPSTAAAASTNGAAAAAGGATGSAATSSSDPAAATGAAAKTGAAAALALAGSAFVVLRRRK